MADNILFNPSLNRQEKKAEALEILSSISFSTEEELNEFKKWMINYLAPSFEGWNEGRNKFSDEIKASDSAIDVKNIYLNYGSNDGFPNWHKIVIDWSRRNETEQRKEIVLPGIGKLINNFAIEIADALKDKNVLFLRIDSKEIVEIGKIKLQKSGEEVYTGFVTIKPNKLITLVEKYVIPGINVWNEKEKEHHFKEKSMGSDTAATLLCSEALASALPQINRIFTIPIPILHDGNLTFPNKGYDKRFDSWLPYNAPDISDINMEIDDAKRIIQNMMKEFCFETKQDYSNAVAALLTPFLRGLFPTFCTRAPAFFYLANRERAGKDYLAGICGIVYEGHALEESPICSSEESRTNNTEELRKKILAAMIGGRKRMHFSNNKGFIDNAVFESVITAEKYSDRILGKSEILTFENELDFSLSGNTGIGFTPDFANRCRFIRLFLDVEDANSRKFENPALHNWVMENRGLVLSALFALVRNWMDKGKPAGNTPFASFSKWAEICGGIMESAGYLSPCTPDNKIMLLGGDSETIEMKQLFELCYSIHPEKWITKRDMKDLIMSEENLMHYLDFNTRADQTKFGNKIVKAIGRVFSGIRLIVNNTEIRGSRQEFKFTKETHEENKSIFEDYQKTLDVENEKILEVKNEFK